MGIGLARGRGARDSSSSPEQPISPQMPPAARRRRLVAEEGFTLIELLVVILIIGILASLALVTFIGQRDKAFDASAKSNARNAVSYVEACYTDNQDYSNCVTQGQLSGTPFPIVNGTPGEGEVRVRIVDPELFRVVAGSGSGNHFRIIKEADGTVKLDCWNDPGSCPSKGDW
jgi:type IV pilus assembly protein PilA